MAKKDKGAEKADERVAEESTAAEAQVTAEEATPSDEEPKKAGKQDTKPTQPTGEALGFTGGDVKMVPLDEIDLDNTQYMFRLDLRTGPLERSLREQGLQVPVILRTRGRGQRKHQIISGFRRVTAASRLGWSEIGAVIRSGLDDEGAFKAAVLENTNRKTYSDIDRALVIHEYRTRGLGKDDQVPLAVLGLSKRQQRNLLSLLDLPKTAQTAIDDGKQAFSATHGLTLKQLKGKYPKLDWRKWIKTVNDTGLSVAQLKRMANKEHGGADGSAGFSGLFREGDTNIKKGVVRFNPVKLDVAGMTDEEKKALKKELEKVLGLL